MLLFQVSRLRGTKLSHFGRNLSTKLKTKTSNHFTAMKKTILLLLALLCFAACVPDYPTWSDKGEPQIIKYDIPRGGTYPASVSILDINYKGSRHEVLVLHKTGVTHWPSCKYCEKDKEKGNQEKKQEFKQLVIDKTLIEPLKTPNNKQQ